MEPGEDLGQTVGYGRMAVTIELYPEWVHHELENWSRWCWQGKFPHPLPSQTCASFEKNYRRHGEEEEQLEDRPIPANADRAKIVQTVWDSLSPRQQQVLRAEYPQRHTSGRLHSMARAAKNLGMSADAYEAALCRAANSVKLAFEEVT